MSNRTTYYDSNSVMREVVTSNHDSEVIHHTAQDVEPVIEVAKSMREAHATHGGARVGTDNMVPVAEIPMMVYEQAAREGWLHDEKKWKQWLNDPQNACFRITDGRA